ncbi:MULTISPECIES: thermonuclease family protein [unclassified Paenibacillus]|uniref:thermonuclease family protein n=1 Tax=unclassified Paenibacillus TaxID=185978 RepID=UPI000896E4C8|nr:MULTISPECIES: thermonuclease family protein [unclassified Paenibacillus]MCM3130139.1 thermonuclease family protein [Paenibacillus sp. MER 78]SDX70358.1 micrococcal nuclease [Paenibacillus sp. PDC88]SFS88060.1 micrococcal nuclease [Paenibacillus sp. 453mf]
MFRSNDGKKQTTSYIIGGLAGLSLIIFLGSFSTTEHSPTASTVPNVETNTVEQVNKNSDQATTEVVRTSEDVSEEAKPKETTEVNTNDNSEPIGSGRLPATLIEVIDGDTLHVEVEGREEKVRLLLIDTPETVHPQKEVQPFGKDASNFVKKQTNKGDIELELDVSERDKYGRLLAYVWVNDKMLNEQLLEYGLARVAYIYPPNTKYVDQFEEIQKTAQKASKGIWSIENYVQEEGFVEPEPEIKAPVIVKEEPIIEEEPQVEVVEEEVVSNVYYKNCSAVRAAGADPIYAGDPGYSTHLDRDGDGVGCEK